jgi:hypothetical protein
MTKRARIRDIITATALIIFLAAMTPGIHQALGQIQGGIQSIQTGVQL